MNTTTEYGPITADDLTVISTALGDASESRISEAEVLERLSDPEAEDCREQADRLDALAAKLDANALRIAALPDLLAFARMVAARDYCDCDEPDPGESGTIQCDPCAARAAIAKAGVS